MGATTFFYECSGSTAEEAFDKAVKECKHQFGRAGYTGTIAEKRSFVLIKCPEDMTPAQYARTLIDLEDERIDDKWGPAGCIALAPEKFLFFGWASE